MPGASRCPDVGPVADWLAAKPTTRWVGAVYSEARAQDYLHSADPRREMDILAFVETTSAARANPLGRRPVWSRHEPALTEGEMIAQPRAPRALPH